LRMANALPSAGLIKLHETEHLGITDTEHLGITDQGKSQPQQESGREKQSAKGSRNCFGGWPCAIVRPFHGQHSIDSWRALLIALHQLGAKALCVGRASLLLLLVRAAFSRSAARSRHRQQDECRKTLCIVLPPTNFRQLGDSWRGSSSASDVYKRYRIVLCLASQSRLFHETIRDFRDRHPCRGLRNQARASQPYAGSRLPMKQRHAKDRERQKIVLANADSMPGVQVSGRITHAVRTRADDNGHPGHQTRISVGCRSASDVAADHCRAGLPPPSADELLVPPTSTHGDRSWTVSW
jgi:hypothetical protein